MNTLLRLNSVRARLLALMLFILAPVALLSMVLATTTYRSVNQAIELAQIEIASNYAARARIWFRGALRMTVAMATAAHSAGLDDRGCSAALRDVTMTIYGVQALSLRYPGASACHFSALAGVGAGELDRLREQQRARPPVSIMAGPDTGQARYDVTDLGGAPHLLIYTRLEVEGSAEQELLVLMDLRLLDAAFDIGALDTGVIVGLLNRGQQVLVARGAEEQDRSWLPREERITTDASRRSDADAGGLVHAYAGQLVSEPDMYVLARFDAGPARAAFIQFLIMSLTPLVTLVVLFLAYARAINGDVLRWMRTIEHAARERLAGGFQRVPLNAAMPEELRSVAGAHNALIDDVERRERELQGLLARNTELMRELNHHVKNSLQVIQSYLALSRRESRDAPDRKLLETEAKILVLSSAYRLALQDGALQPAPLKPFLDEIVATLATHARDERQWIEVRVASEMFPLVVDRAIPLGLAVVEAVSAALRAPGCALVMVSLDLAGEGIADLLVTGDGAPGTDRPPARILHGLATQIGADVRPAEPQDYLRWTIRK